MSLKDREAAVEPLKNAMAHHPLQASKETAPHSFNALESAKESRHHVQVKNQFKCSGIRFKCLVGDRFGCSGECLV